jgi:hypothetical protein
MATTAALAKAGRPLRLIAKDDGNDSDKCADPPRLQMRLRSLPDRESPRVRMQAVQDLPAVHRSHEGLSPGYPALATVS